MALSNRPSRSSSKGGRSGVALPSSVNAIGKARRGSSRPTTVSYTHLDVYKRQFEGLLLGLFFMAVGMGINVPVSYTHLDVYKRQAVPSPRAPR